jgi:hypothetical protein
MISWGSVYVYAAGRFDLNHAAAAAIGCAARLFCGRWDSLIMLSST